ncbi:MAG: FtsH protease activity modulator HflK [Desulfurivibrionaceae bacterium]|nr:FtsH protease activity modulator HflK [Desulfurivibrionaceae bacterium]
MAWEDEQDPWGKKKGPQTPEEFIAVLIQKVKEAFSGGGSGGEGGSGRPSSAGPGLGKIGLVIGVILLISVAGSAFFTVNPGEEGVVLRFGRYLKAVGPGLNFKIPLVDVVTKVDVKTVRKEEFGFRTLRSAQRTQYDKRGYDNESLMLTGDKNVIDFEWIVQYKIKDPFNYLFKVKNITEAVRDISETSIRQSVGNMDFDYILGNRQLLADSTTKNMQEILDRYESGVYVVKVQLQDVNPPDAVKPAFNEVNEADQDMKRLVNEAEENYNREIPRARGRAKQVLEEAQGYAVQRVNRAEGETSRFLDILKEYTRSRDVTRKRMYLETMQDVLPKVDEVFIVDEGQKGILPLLNLNKSNK